MGLKSLSTKNTAKTCICYFQANLKVLLKISAYCVVFYSVNELQHCPSQAKQLRENGNPWHTEFNIPLLKPRLHMATTWCAGWVSKLLCPLPGYNQRYRHVDRFRSSAKAKWAKENPRRFINNEIRFCFAAAALIKSRRRSRSCARATGKKNDRGLDQPCCSLRPPSSQGSPRA